jgi:TPR repeat protein
VAYDIERAVKYYTLSSQQGNPATHYRLGLIYKETNNLMPQDLDKALHHLRSAALINHPSLLELGKKTPGLFE